MAEAIKVVCSSVARRVLLATLAFFPSAVLAATVDPILIDLSSKNPVRSVRFTNTDNSPKVIQLEAHLWQQTNGADTQEETTALTIAPLIMRIPAGGTQIFRVSEKRAAASSNERAYRLILEDITADADLAPRRQGELRFRVNINLPLFSAPTALGKALPVWSRCIAPTNKVCLRLDNQGNKRIRVSQVRLVNSNGEQPLQIIDTVLAGSWKQWIVDGGRQSASATQVRFRSEDGETTASIAPQAAQ